MHLIIFQRIDETLYFTDTQDPTVYNMKSTKDPEVQAYVSTLLDDGSKYLLRVNMPKTRVDSITMIYSYEYATWYEENY
jgi:hypothetical protein